MNLARPSQSLGEAWWIRQTWIFAVAVGTSLGALGHAEMAATPRVLSKSTVRLSAAVNWDFRRLPKLDAWRNTAVVIGETLSQWYPPSFRGPILENADRGAFHGFFSQIAKAAPEDCSLVYLASHQSPAGYWHFPHDSAQSWPEIVAGLPSPAPSPQCLIVDACFAEAADSAVLLQATGASGILYASDRAEVVHELNFHQRFPIDLTHQYSAEAKWLRDTLGEAWNGRVSFLGFIWLRAYLATARVPKKDADWVAFFHRCESLAAEFRRGRGESLASTFHFIARPEPVRYGPLTEKSPQVSVP